MSEWFMGSGGWYKTIGGDGPYSKDGDNYTLIGAGGGSGGAVDVLGTKLTGFKDVTASEVTEQDDVLVAFEKLQATVKVLQSKIEQLEGTK